jgi:3-phosphoshikimate 1-carboxyvinyltransferase
LEDRSEGLGGSVLDAIEIKPRGAIRGSIRPPGSKSITNRALVCAALARGRSTLTGALDSEDTQVMIDCLSRLGIDVQMRDAATTLLVDGCGGQIPAGDAMLMVRNSGTTIRFLTAMVTLGQGTFKLDGIERMRQRPIGDLLDALNQLGADAQSEAGTGCPPVVVRASGLRGGRAAVRGDISSQYLSGLLMAAPYAQQDVTLEVQGELVSKPYVEMTLRGMQSFGVSVPAGDLSKFTIPGRQTYQATEYSIEPDASAASYFWGAAAVTGGEVTVEGLSRDALQGDVAFVECLARMGCKVDYTDHQITVRGKRLRGVELDMNAISDTVQTLAVVALFAEGATTIRGVAHIRHKETDRIGDLARELRKLGATVDEFDDGLRITPPAGGVRGAQIDTYNDHRMAMSLSLAGLRTPGVVIRDPGCTAKTYPRFFEDLESVGRS